MRRRRVTAIAVVAIVAAVVAAFVATGSGRGIDNASDIPKAPAFSADQLSAPAERDWITNGGSINNNRYSALDDVVKSNVGNLKLAWSPHLDGSGGTRAYSQESTPLVF